MAHKNLEERKAYFRKYYIQHREQILEQVRAWGKANPRKRKRKNFKNRLWCKIEDKPLWKKIQRKWLHYVHDVPHLLTKAVSNIKNISDNDYFEKKKRSNDERKAARRDIVARYMSKPGVHEDYLTKRRVRSKKNFHKNYYGNIQNRITCSLRGRVHRLISKTNARKSMPTFQLLGCTLEFFKQYLESKFTKGMSWDNYGKKGWHVDHTVACRRFTLEKESHQRACFHFSNLGPVWEPENLSKDSRPVPKLTDDEVNEILRTQAWITKIVPIPQPDLKQFPATTAGITQPNKAEFSSEQTAQLG